MDVLFNEKQFRLEGNGDHELILRSKCGATVSVTTSYLIAVPENENSTLKMEFLVPNTMHAKEGKLVQQQVRVTNHGEAMGMVTVVVG